MHPWLAVPLRDYEGHMNSEAVGQLGPLAELFGAALRACRPESLAILGVAGGNGLERIDPALTRRICAIDLNPEYLETVRGRYRALPGLELHRLDLAAQAALPPPVQLVHAALIFEHAGTDRCLDHAVQLVAPGGFLSVVLQLPSATEAAVGYAAPPSIQGLRDDFHFVDREFLRRRVGSRGFHLLESAERPLPSGKAFWLGIFASSAA